MYKKLAIGFGILGIIVSSLSLAFETPTVWSQVNTLVWTVSFTIATLSWD